MGWFTGIVVFLLIWWVMIFTVLPWGLRRNVDGIPEKPMLWRKILITTAVSVVLWLVIFALAESDIISFREMAYKVVEKDAQP